jgi:hypothetical protein
MDKPPSLSRILTKSGRGFLLGLNYPWREYGWDFGGLPQRKENDQTLPAAGGVSGESITACELDFKTMRKAGVSVVRWFVFCDGRGGIEFKKNAKDPTIDEEPQRLNPYVLPDVRQALQIAAKNHVYLVLSLLNHSWSFQSTPLSPANPHIRAGGHGQVLLKREWRRALLENVILPFITDAFVHNHPNLLAIEFMNEPELIIADLEPQRPSRSKDGKLNSGVVDTDMIPSPRMKPKEFSEFLEWVAEVQAAVHAQTTAAFTIGCRKLAFARHWLGILDPKRDFMQIHYWAKLLGEEHKPDTPPEVDLYHKSWQELTRQWNKEIPVVWGEFTAHKDEGGYNDGQGVPLRISLESYLQKAYLTGFAGALPWAFGRMNVKSGKPDNPVRKDGAWGVDKFGGPEPAALIAWAKLYPDIDPGPP